MRFIKCIYQVNYNCLQILLNIINKGGINEIYVARSDVHLKFVHISPYYIISLDCTTFNGYDNSGIGFGIKEKHVLIASLPHKSKI